MYRLTDCRLASDACETSPSFRMPDCQLRLTTSVFRGGGGNGVGRAERFALDDVSEAKFEAAEIGMIVHFEGEGDVHEIACQNRCLLDALGHAPTEGVEAAGVLRSVLLIDAQL